MERTIFRIQKMVFYCYIYMCDSLGLYPRGVFQMLYDFFWQPWKSSRRLSVTAETPEKLSWCLHPETHHNVGPVGRHHHQTHAQPVAVALFTFFP